MKRGTGAACGAAMDGCATAGAPIGKAPGVAVVAFGRKNAPTTCESPPHAVALCSGNVPVATGSGTPPTMMESVGINAGPLRTASSCLAFRKQPTNTNSVIAPSTHKPVTLLETAAASHSVCSTAATNQPIVSNLIMDPG